MSTTIVLAARIERYHIHVAVCRARRQGLCCSTCSDFAESAERAERRLGIPRESAAGVETLMGTLAELVQEAA